jgi:hypothetical protein
MKVGRPTKYSEEIQTKAEEYLSKCNFELDEFHKTRGERSDSYERIAKFKLPSMAGLALHLKVNKSTLHEWRDANEEFSVTLDELMQLQEEMITEGSMNGVFNPTISKLLLMSNHGHKEKTDIDHTSGGEPLQITSEIAKAKGINDPATQ